jgi:hypothetical protein
MRRVTMRYPRLGLAALALLAGQVIAADEPGLRTDQDRLSYALGMDLGAQMRRLGVSVDPAVFARALADGLAGNETLMTQADAQVTIQMLQAQLQRRQAEAKAGADPASAAPGATPAAPPAGTGATAAPSN